MRIVIATPLYPPDTGAQAFYAKEMARRLAAAHHEVVVVAYGRLPEALDGVRVEATDKRLIAPVRMFLFARALMREAKLADIVYLQNGSSAELPTGIVARLARVRVVAHISDARAHTKAASHPLLRLIERFAFAPARAFIENMPLERPEIIPFEEYPEAAMRAYEESWSTHMRKAEEIFLHAK